MRPAVSDRDYGPTLGEPMTINAPGRICHGERGKVISLHLRTNEATVQLPSGTQHIVPWSAESADRHPHGTRNRYKNGCGCLECYAAAAEYAKKQRLARNRERVPPPPAPHGSLRRYRAGCRCDQCRSANAKHTSDWRHR